MLLNINVGLLEECKLFKLHAIISFYYLGKDKKKKTLIWLVLFLIPFLRSTKNKKGN